MTFRAWEDDDLNSAGRVLVGQARDQTLRVERVRDELNDELSMIIGVLALARITIGYMTNAKIAEGCDLLDKILARPPVAAFLRSQGRTYAREQSEDGETRDVGPLASNSSWREGYDAFLDELEGRS